MALQTLNWPVNRTFDYLGSKISHGNYNSVVIRYWKTAALRAASFFAKLETDGGRLYPTSPAVRATIKRLSLRHEMMITAPSTSHGVWLLYECDLQPWVSKEPVVFSQDVVFRKPRGCSNQRAQSTYLDGLELVLCTVPTQMYTGLLASSHVTSALLQRIIPTLVYHWLVYHWMAEVASPNQSHQAQKWKLTNVPRP